MDQATKKRFSMAIAALCSAFNREADQPLLMGYEIGLDDLTAQQIEQAVKAALRSSRFMPTVAELRELAGVVTPEARAVIAWEAFSKASLNPYQSVDFDDPVVNATVRNLGGWQYVTSIEDQKEFEVFLRAKFEKAYVALYRTGISAEQAAPLTGYLEQQNRFNGYTKTEFNGVAINQVTRIATGLPKPLTRIGARVPNGNPLAIAVLKKIEDA